MAASASAKKNKGDRPLQGPDKAAVLLLALGQPLSGRLLSHFDTGEIKQVTRSIADLGAVSAKQISDIVGGVRQANDAAFQSITRAKEQALAGASQTEEIRTAVAQMDQSSARVSEAIAAIAESLREQSATSADIASRVEVIAQGIEHTHDAADKSRQRSGALVNLSHSLKQEVGKFRV